MVHAYGPCWVKPQVNEGQLVSGGGRPSWLRMMVTACSTGLLASFRRRSSARSRASDGDEAAATVMLARASLTQYKNWAIRLVAGGNGMPSSRRSNSRSVAAISRRSRWAAARRMRSCLCSRPNSASSRRFPATAIARYLVASALRYAPTVRPDVAECGGAPVVWAGAPVVWAGAPVVWAGVPVVWAGAPPHPAANAATTAARAAIAAQRGRPGLAMTAWYCRPAARRASCLALRRHVGFHRLPGAVHLRRLVPGQLAAVDGYHYAGDERGLVR